MNKFLLGAAALSVLAVACNKESKLADGNKEQSLNATAKTTNLGWDTLRGVIGAGQVRSLNSDTLYYLDGKLFVNDGGTLNIPAGTTILGIKKATPELASAIVVCRGGTINANGTANKPIIMRPNTYPNCIPGDWGGVVLLGRAQHNQASDPTIEGINLPTLPSGVNVNYGGTNNADNSGTFQYVRIEYAGAIVTPNNELNGLTLGSVGALTNINHVMVTYGADDGFEWFGGTVNGTHLISFANNDDLFDFDFGFRGRLQFCLGYMSETLPGGYGPNSNGIESDNDAQGSLNTPSTFPKISNMTLIGRQTKAQQDALNLWFGAHFRRRCKYDFRNSFIMGWDSAFVANSDTCQAYVNAGARYNVISGFARAGVGTGTNPVVPNLNWHSTTKRYRLDSLGITDANQYNPNSTTATWLVNPFPLGVNALVTGLEPKAGTLKTGANFTGTVGFTQVPFKGAVGNLASNWLLENWVDFTP